MRVLAMYSKYMDIVEYSVIGVEMRLLLYGLVFVRRQVWISFKDEGMYRYNMNASQDCSVARSSSSWIIPGISLFGIRSASEGPIMRNEMKLDYPIIPHSHLPSFSPRPAVNKNWQIVTRNLEYNLRNFDFKDWHPVKTNAARSYSLQSKYDLPNKYLGKSCVSESTSLCCPTDIPPPAESIDIDWLGPPTVSKSMLFIASAALSSAITAICVTPFSALIHPPFRTVLDSL